MSAPFLSSVAAYPLKSARGILLDRAEVQAEGLALDRRFLAHTADGTFVSGRSHPRLVLIQARWDGLDLTLAMEGQPELVLQPTVGTPTSVAVWKDRFAAWDQGDEAAAWLSRALGDSLRLAWLGESQRPLRWDPARRVTFADAAPLLVLGEASVADLGARVGEPMPWTRFRPNLLVAGTSAYEEDSWKRIRIGQVEYQVLDSCSRCEFTTIDPETAARHPRNEPVATLEKYRKNDTGIYLGMNLMPLSGGEVHRGDKVEVLERKRPVFFVAAFPRTLVCRAVHDEAPGVKTWQLAPADGLPLTWHAGQYLTLRLDLPEGPVRRSYSLSNAPGSAAEVTVKRLEGGRGSGWLHANLTPGCTVTAEAVGGTFTFQDHPWNSYLFLGAGSGVTPLMALLRSLARDQLDLDVAFHQSARFAGDLLFSAELDKLAAVLGPRLSVARRITSAEGRLDHRSLVAFCPDLRDRQVFVCGPPEYRAQMRLFLASSGVKVDRRYHEEVFGEAALEPPSVPVPGRVTFSRSGKAVASDGRTTVLQLAERSGIDLRSSCRSGDCGTCRVASSTGAWVLACQTYPEGDQTYEF